MTRKRIFTFVLIVAGILITLFFGLRAFHAFKKINGHRPPPPDQIETDVELIREWMTVPFIARMYYVPDKVIFEALEISPKDNHDKSLKEINNKYFPETEGLVLQIVKTAILEWQAKSTIDVPLTPVPPLTPIPPLTPVPPVNP